MPDPRPAVDPRRLGEFCDAVRAVVEARETLSDTGGRNARQLESACDLSARPTAMDPATGRPFDVTLRMGPGERFEFHPQREGDLEVANALETFLSGRAEADPSYRVADHLRRDRQLVPSLEAELDRLRTILEKEAPGQPGGVLITYNCRDRILALNGYSENPYKGSTWVVRLTPAYTRENQTDIARYVRDHEDEIVEEVRRLVPRRRRGHSVDFSERHPELHARRFVNPEGGRAGYFEPADEETERAEMPCEPYMQGSRREALGE